MSDERVSQAARNNALWCQAVCSARGCPGEFAPSLWINRNETPPFYGNAVTLTPDGVDEQLHQLGRLEEVGLCAGWGVKDSYRTLALAGLGFRRLFDGEWLHREPGASARQPTSEGVRWTIVEGEEALAAWEAAWRGDPANALPAGEPPIFQAGLLADPDIAFVAAQRGAAIVGGGIANRHSEAVGLSNLFVSNPGEDAPLAGLLSVVIDAYPGLPLVGYEPAGATEAFEQLGFKRVGPLRVWVREG